MSDALEVTVGREGEPLRANVFVSVVASIVRSLTATAQHLVPATEGEPVWIVADLHHSQATVALAPLQPTEHAQAAMGRMVQRFVAWEQRPADPLPLEADELDAYAQVAQSARALAVRLAYRAEQTRVTEASWRALDTLAARRVRDITTVEGRLEQLNVHGQFQAGIYEAWSGRRIPCVFREDLWPDVVAHLRQYVVAEGEATYHRGTIVKFDLRAVRGIPDRAPWPSDPDAWVGLDPDGYGHMPAEAYIRHLWELPNGD